MGFAPLGFQLRFILIRQLQPSPVVDRRPAEGTGARTAALQFLRRFVTGIKQPGISQPVRGRIIAGDPLRLAFDPIGGDAQPAQVPLDGVGIFGLGALQIGIVEAQD